MSMTSVGSNDLTGATAGVAVRQLRVALGGQTIIEALDLEVRAGEFLVLLGPSGCGKSTLLHAIAGLTAVSAGAIEIAGRDHTRSDPKDRNIGMVFQSYALYPTMTVAGNLGFGLRARGMARAEVAQRVQRTAELLQLETLLARRPGQLSGGQRQRVAIGRALVRDAQVFLLDEPLSNLDANLRATLRRELKLLHQRLGATMIYVTHDQVEALTLATRVAVMHGGRIQQLGTPTAVYEQPVNRFVAGFVGSPPMNFCTGTFKEAASGWQFVAPGVTIDLGDYAFTGAAPASGEAVLLGIRPEYLRLGAASPLQGVVRLVEPMGTHQVVWFDLGETRWSALGHAADGYHVGATLPVAIEPGRLMLFNNVDGARR